jgi:FixJ family two-component response regulator
MAFRKLMKGQSPPPPSSRIVAVVDGDPAVRSALQFSLGVEGYEVCTFGDAAELLGDPAMAHFACIIIDQNPPTSNGLELFQRLRDDAVLTPVILITGQPSGLLIQRARKAGVPVVEKPLLDNALADQIESLLKC